MRNSGGSQRVCGRRADAGQKRGDDGSITDAERHQFGGKHYFSWNEEHKSNSELKAENEKLNERLEALRMQNRLLEQDQVELERLQDLLDLKEKYKQYNTVGARVISKGSGNWFEIFAIDKGSKDGIKKI